MCSVHFFSILLLLLALTERALGNSQRRMTSGAITLAQSVPNRDEFLNSRDVGYRFINFMYPQNLAARAQTPIVVRWGLIYTMAQYDVNAACDPKKLSFFGTNDDLPSHLCDLVNRVLVWIYTLNYVYRREHPILGVRSTQYLMSLGLTPLSRTTNRSTAIGFANFLGARMTRYLKNDGWNSRGHPRQDFGRPFSDNTDYKPLNDPDVPETKLKYPLRWQPLTQTDHLGNFFMQKHVTPHLGITAKPILSSRRQLLRRRTKGPYLYPNRRNMHPKDKANVMRESFKLFRFSARLTKKKIQETYLWDNKFYSTGIFSVLYLLQLQAQGYLTAEQTATLTYKFQLAEAIAMYDATILAWNEKRRHDLARPQTFIRRLFNKNKRVHAFRGPGFGFGSVRAVEWEPLIQAQPHSEYPSGSAMLCTSNFESLELGLRAVFGKNGTANLPPFRFIAPSSIAVRNPYIQRLNFTYRSTNEMARRCGYSRLSAGIHFTPAIRDGAKAVKGIGRLAINFMTNLENGKVPKYCRHCQ